MRGVDPHLIVLETFEPNGTFGATWFFSPDTRAQTTAAAPAEYEKWRVSV